MFRLSVSLLVALIATAAAPTRSPVLVELFTSEGCSSCPPADRLLALLDSQAIVLSEHVDYWDHQGWRDPFSSHSNTIRQQAYARNFGLQGPYTPQMVIDGSVEFLGSDGRRAGAEIDRARAREKVAIRLTRTQEGLAVESDPLPRSADLMLATVQAGADSEVKAGENNGKSLHHVAILRSLRKLASVKKGAAVHQTVKLSFDPGSRLVVFAQEPGAGPVFGVAVE
jgi:hypothetical protein